MPSRTSIISAWFSLPPDLKSQTSDPKSAIPLPSPGQILLIAGPSGSGKSTLLRRLRRALRPRPIIDLARVRLPPRPVIDLFPRLSLHAALGLLSSVGLAEAHTYLLPPRKLSAGQRWRLRLALAITESLISNLRSEIPHRPSGPPALVSDEFASLLDPLTAAVVAHALRRIIDRHPRASAILATPHTHLLHALRPDIVVHCDFGQLTIRRTP